MAVPTPPSTGGDTSTNELVLPDSTLWRSVIIDALVPLTLESYWEQSTGGVTPLEAAQIVSEAIGGWIPKGDTP